MTRARVTKEKGPAPKVSVYDQEGKKLKEAVLPESVVAASVNPALLTAAVRMYQTNQRFGTSKVKNRHQVTGSTRKIYRQKGTGQARHGDIKAPIFVGGGVTFGPRPREWRYQLPKKALKKALAQALAYVNQNGKLGIVDKIEWAKPKTKQAVELIKKLGMTAPLFVLDAPTDPVLRSLRNIAGIGMIDAQGLNAMDVLRHNELVITQGSLAALEKRLSAGGKA